ncbi:jg13488 [Pararge aegeria aegeria]|uniref:Jg13488 protein n=1 Tax=Pararge aegeria aegeria TaxID=348720 RepID=A0A8S4QVJ3_9NEOP|nr:jg13488 [Pararge aegeria aegeria]
MFGCGYRTPTKMTASQEEDNDSSMSPIGQEECQPVPPPVHWEIKTASKHNSPMSPPKDAQPGPSKPMAKAAMSRGCSAAARKRRVHSEATISSPDLGTTKPGERLKEAKACVVKAKTQLNSSRNTKTEIKAEVMQAVERLFQLVKEAEAAKPLIISSTGEGCENGKEIKENKKHVEGKDKNINIVKELEEHAKVLKENTEEVLKLQKQIEKLQEGGLRKEETGEEVLNKVRSAINARDGGVQVEKVRKAKDRKIIVSCGSKEEREKVIRRLREAGDHLNIEKIQNKDPLVVLKDVLQYNTDEDILRAINNQNQALLKDLNNEDTKMEIRYRKKTRNPLTCHVVMRVSPKLWATMTTIGTVHIDLQRIRVTDQSPLIQCSMCLGYGHSRRHCRDTQDKCSHCGGTHLKSNCEKWLAGTTPSCCNCMQAGLDTVGHNAFSSECVVFQANLQRKELATQELMIEAEKSKTAIALIQEPYVGGIGRMRDYPGVRIFQCTDSGVVKAAVAVFDRDMVVTQDPKLTTNNIAAVKIATNAWEIGVISFYLEPNQPIEPYLDQLRKVVEEIGPRYILVGGDANAKNTWWGSRNTDRRGEEMESTLDELDLQVLNQGSTPTFDTIRGTKSYSSFVDITTCSSDMLGLVEDWEVDDSVTSSDHNTLKFKIRLEKGKGITINRTTRIFNTKKANWDEFHVKLAQSLAENKINKIEIEKIQNKTQLDQIIETYTNIIIKTCKSSIPIYKTIEKLNLPWWSEELATLKQEVVTKKRRIRCAASVRRTKVVEEYLKIKEKYELLAKHAQIASWKSFCGKQDREGLWDGIYRVLSRTTKRQEDLPLIKDGKTHDPKESVKMLAETFYPDDTRKDDNEDHRQIRVSAEQVNEGTENEFLDPPFTTAEVCSAVSSFNPKKAPGQDGLTPDVCQHAILSNPEVYLTLANKCLYLGHFPKIWKEATVVVLRKASREDYTNPKAYRPIGLLPVLGKTLEKMLLARLKWHILPSLSNHQYGFMPQKCTEDALYALMQHINSKLKQKKIVTLISLDIEGAFDSAWWPAIKLRLAEERCPINVRRVFDSYLRDRRVRVRYAGEEHVRSTTKGCVQGSIGGPILWNLLLDPLLKGLEQRGDYCQAFADDVILVFDDDTGLRVSERANAALAFVQEWGVRNKLKFAPQKTKAMVITRKLKYDSPLLSMGGSGVGLSSEIKILGLTIDQSLTFNAHMRSTCKKVQAIYKKLCRAAKVSWGLHPEVIKTIYTAVVEPIVLYAASAWAPATKKLGVRRQLNAVQRTFAQKITKAYRTVSLNAAMILAGILPLDLRVQEAAALYKAKKGVFHQLPDDRAIEVKLEYAAQHIGHPADRTEIGYSLPVTLTETTNGHTPDCTLIYTDGSKIEGKVGAAVSVWDRGVETRAIKLKLEPYCTVFQAELLAIDRATQWARNNTKSEYCILSDSRSALDLIKSGKVSHPLAHSIRRNIGAVQAQGRSIKLCWIKAHVGNVGNERADALAKEAALNTKTTATYSACPISYAKRMIRGETQQIWQNRYDTESTAGTTKIFFPDVRKAHKIMTNTEITPILTQTLSGHGGFAKYLHRFKLKDTPACKCDTDKDEEPIHLLVECPRFAQTRHDLEVKLDVNINVETLKEIMLNKYTRTDFLEYAIKIVKKIRDENK